MMDVTEGLTEKMTSEQRPDKNLKGQGGVEGDRIRSGRHNKNITLK